MTNLAGIARMGHIELVHIILERAWLSPWSA